MDNYDEWLTEMLITHGVDREHRWDEVYRGDDAYERNNACELRHWISNIGEDIWHFTQAAVDYLKKRGKSDE